MVQQSPPDIVLNCISVSCKSNHNDLQQSSEQQSAFCKPRRMVSSPFDASLFRRQAAFDRWQVCLQQVGYILQIVLLTADIALANLVFALASSPASHLPTIRLAPQHCMVSVSWCSQHCRPDEISTHSRSLEDDTSSGEIDPSSKAASSYYCLENSTIKSPGNDIPFFRGKTSILELSVWLGILLFSLVERTVKSNPSNNCLL